MHQAFGELLRKCRQWMRGERSTMAPSLRRSITTSGGPSKTCRSGGFVDVPCVFVAVSVIGLVARDFGTAFFQKRLHPRFGLVIALRDRRGKRLGGETGGGIAAGDARQDMHHGVVGERRIAGNLVGQLIENRPVIEDVARRKYLSGQVEPDGTVMIRTADIPH